MEEWLSYSLSDFLLFSPRTYYRLFEIHNRAIWPAQIVTLLFGAVILLLARRGGAWRARLIAAILAGCWLWVGWAYHLQRYSTINWIAPYFAAGFAIQALLLSWTGVMRGRLSVRFDARTIGRAGLCIFLFALLVQPLIGPLVGRDWMQAETFGGTPDPTAVATLGLLLAAGRVAWPLLIVPLLWCAISGATLWAMDSPDAMVVPGAAAVVLLLALWQSLAGRAAARR
jgi:hypothetical protein